MKILEHIRITAGDIWMLRKFQVINKIILLQVGVVYTRIIDDLQPFLKPTRQHS